MFGKVHYENEAGEFRVVECPDEATYENELAAGIRWVEESPRLARDVWGERIKTADDYSWPGDQDRVFAGFPHLDVFGKKLAPLASACLRAIARSRPSEEAGIQPLKEENL